MTRILSEECRQVLAGVSAYLDGELDAAQCEKIERHCAGCKRCADVVLDLRRTVSLCREAGAHELPREAREKARDNIKRLLMGLPPLRPGR